MSADTQNILLNTEVIAVNQDSLGIAGHRVASPTSSTQVWAGPLSQSSVAVVLFNVGPQPANITVHWTDLGINPNLAVTVRDVWQHQTLPNHIKTSLTWLVPSHDVAMFVFNEGPIA